MKTKIFQSQFEREDFHCEQESLNHYIKEQVSQDIKKNLTACFVILEKKKVIAFYTLSNASIERQHVPDKYRKKVPKAYGVPVTLLGRLARDINHKGKNLGEILLIDALERSLEVSSIIGSMAVVVDPIDDFARKFYKKYGFKELQSGKMFLSMKAIEKAFANV